MLVLTYRIHGVIFQCTRMVCVCLFTTIYAFKLQLHGLAMLLNVILYQIKQCMKLTPWILMKPRRYVEIIRVNKKCQF
jgi:hypothetical protein